MSGVFVKSNRPRRPGAYVNFIAKAPDVIPPNVASVVAVPFTHDWGPMEEVVQCNSWQEFLSIYGGDPDDPTDGYIAVRGAFEGEGMPDEGRNGAGAVLAFRQGGTAQATATKTLAGGTTTNAFVIDAIYPGTRGNDLKVSTADYATDTTKDVLLVYDGSELVERYVYDDGELEALATAINDSSSWIQATANVDGEDLVVVTSQALVGGNDGTTLLAGDYTALMAALDDWRFGVFAPYNLTDDTIQQSIFDWAQTSNQAGRRFFAVFGGALDETPDTANDRSRGFDDPDVINCGVGSLEHPTFGVLSTAKVVPWLAGIIAAAGETRSITAARLASFTKVLNGASPTEMDTCFDAGTVVFSRDSNRTAPVRVEQGLTTFTDGAPGGGAADPNRDYTIFRNVRFNSIFHSLDTEFTEWYETNFIGAAGGLVDQAGRESAIAFAKKRLDAREKSRIVQPGWTVDIDQDPPPTAEDEFIALVVGLKPTREANQVYITFRVS